MSGWKTHLTVGAIASLVALAIIYIFKGIPQIFDIRWLVLLAMVIFLGSLFPDLDIGTSYIFHVVFTGGLIAIIISFLRGYSNLGIVCALILIVLLNLHHRGALHSILADILLSVPIYFYDNLLGMIFFLCFLSHLILDEEVKII